MKRTLMILPFSLALGISSPGAEDSPEKEAAEDQAAENAERETAAESRLERLRKLEADIQQKEQAAAKLRKEIEAAREEERKNSKGNVYHVEELIDAEMEVLMAKIDEVEEKIEAARDHNVKAAEATFEKTKTFSYEDKMSSVQKFLETSKAALQKVVDSKALNKAESKVSDVEQSS